MKEIGIEPLSDKQAWQLYDLCMEFQPYTKTDDVVFLEVVKAARIICNRSMYQFVSEKEKRFDLMMKFIASIKNKYYFNGIKYAKRYLAGKQSDKYYNACKYPIVGMPDFGIFHYWYSSYQPKEKELLMKITRACRDYMRAKMSKEAEQVFFERLWVVRDAMGK